MRNHKRGLLNVLISNVPGARSFVVLVSTQLTLFLILVMLSTYIFLKVIQPGEYAGIILKNNIHIIIILWIIFWFFLFIYSIRSVLNISYYVAGPIKRVEKMLDNTLNGVDTPLSVRQSDALSGVVQKVNAIILMYKNNEIIERNNAIKIYRAKIEEAENKTKGIC